MRSARRSTPSTRCSSSSARLSVPRMSSTIGSAVWRRSATTERSSRRVRTSDTTAKASRATTARHTKVTIRAAKSTAVTYAKLSGRAERSTKNPLRNPENPLRSRTCEPSLRPRPRSQTTAPAHDPRPTETDGSLGRGSASLGTSHRRLGAPLLSDGVQRREPAVVDSKHYRHESAVEHPSGVVAVSSISREELSA